MKTSVTSLMVVFALALPTSQARLSGASSVAEAAQTSSTSRLHVDLTIQESIYSGVPGIQREQEPVTVGIPLPDSAGITSTSQLGLSGALAGQFRVLGRWPSGNVKWVLINTLADVAAGKESNSTALTHGAGDFGGPALATEDDASITISTGTGTFVVRKKNFNLIDRAVANDHELVKSGASQGLVLTGPSPGNTVCPCSTVYASSNDATSSAVIEENGPVHAVIRATGQLKDTAGHAYMRYTVRLNFYKGKSSTKAVVLLQNADYGPSDSFASAYKAFTSFEARLTPNLGSGRTFAFGTAGSPATGSFDGTENAYLYQGYADKLEFPQWSSPDMRAHYAPRSYIKRTLQDQKGSHRTWAYSQEGFVALHKDTTLAKGGRSDYSDGWADLADASGAGIMIGNYQQAAYWPKSLQFMSGGSEVRVGIWPDQSLFGPGAQDYYQAWPQYSMHTIYLDFHASPLSSAAGEFRRFQFPLVARAAARYYNETKALLYPLVDPAQEDQYFNSLGIICCLKDKTSPFAYRNYNWAAGGGGNQAEMRWSDLMSWLQRGHITRYLDASHFYAFQVEQVFPRSDYNGSDAFNWRERPDSELDPNGLPENILSLNNNKDCDPGEMRCGRNWIDSAHAHWYGMIDYYFMTGDEALRDAIQDGASDLYGNPSVRAVKIGGYWNPRNIGEALMSDARLGTFYDAVGNHPEAETALLTGYQTLSRQVWPELQVSGFGSSTQGVSRTRGLHYGCCPPGGTRVAMPFQQGILSEGLWEYLEAAGPHWQQRQFTFDLAYGIASWTLNEAWRSGAKGQGCKFGTGPTYEINIDLTNFPLDPSCSQTVWFNFYNLAKYTGDAKLWTDKFSQYIRHLNGNGIFYAEYGTIFESAVVNEVLNSSSQQLVPVTVTAERVDPKTYLLSWIVPPGAQSYRIKYSDRNIVEWLNFDPTTNRFGVDPSTNAPWFSALEVSSAPPPGSPGSQQTFQVNGLDPKVQWRFALKAYVKP